MFKRLDGILRMLERGLCGFSLIFITLLVAAGVFLRSLLGVTFSWVEELSQYIMVWIAFFGSVLCVSSGGHVGVDIVFSILPARLHKPYRLALDLFAAAFLVWLAAVAWRYFLTIHASGQVSASMGWMPRSFLYLSALLGSALMALEFAKVSAAALGELLRLGATRGEEGRE